MIGMGCRQTNAAPQWSIGKEGTRMKVIEKLKDWRVSAAGFAMAAVPLGMTVDFGETTALILALLPVIVIFMVIGMILGVLGSIKFHG